MDDPKSMDDPFHPDFFKDLAKDLAELIHNKWIIQLDQAVYDNATFAVNCLRTYYLSRDCRSILTHDTERLLNVAWAYRNNLVAAKLSPLLPHNPGMDSADAIGACLTGDFAQNIDGTLILPNHATLVDSARQWRKRLRRKFSVRQFTTIREALEEPAEEVWIPALFDLFPRSKGRPPKRR